MPRSALVLVLLSLGCGARSNLKTDEHELAAGGAGGMPSGPTTTTTTTTTGGGGGSGPTGFCLPDVPMGVRGFDSATGNPGTGPKLAASGERAAIVQDEIPDIIGDPATVGQITFDPWGAWPLDELIGTARPVTTGFVRGSALARRNFQDGYSLLVAYTDDTLDFYFHADPDLDLPLPSVVMSSPAMPVFVATPGWGAVGRAVGLSTLVSGVTEQIDVLRGTTDALVPVGLGVGVELCAHGPVADAVAIDEETYAIVATRSGTTPGCNPGSPNRVVVFIVDIHSQYVVARHEHDVGGSVMQVAAASASDGVWVLWQANDGRDVGAVIGARYELDGIGHDEVVLQPDGVVYDRWAVAGLDGRLLLAHTDSFDPSAPTVVITAYDDNGAVDGTTSYQAPGDMWIEPGYQLLGAADAYEMILTFRSFFSRGPGTSSVFVERFTCGR